MKVYWLVLLSCQRCHRPCFNASLIGSALFNIHLSIMEPISALIRQKEGRTLNNLHTAINTMTLTTTTNFESPVDLTHVYLSGLWEDATRTERASKPHNDKGPLWLWIKTCDHVTAVKKTKHITALFRFIWVFCLIRHFKFVLKVLSFPLCPRLNWTIVLFLVLHLYINLLLQWSMAY